MPNLVRRDPLATRMLGRQPVLGLIVKMPNPALIEQAHYLGFDLVVIDTEHGASDPSLLEHHLRAADGVGIDALVRVGTNSRLDILRALDAGACGVIVPHVESGTEAEQAVASAHYPPKGRRGLAVSTRGGRYGDEGFAEYLSRVAAETVVIVQIEDEAGVQNVDAIATTGGVNGVWVGPGDLSASLGFPGQSDHPVVRAAVEAVVSEVGRSASTAAAVLVKTPHEIKDWRGFGASMFLVTSVDLFSNAAREIVAAKADLSAADNHPRRHLDGE